MAELSPRVESKMYLTGEQSFELPEIEDVVQQGRQTEVLASLKPLHYARLAESIDLLLGDMQAKKESRAPSGFMTSRYTHNSSWSQLRADTIATVDESIKSIGDTPEFQQTKDVVRFIGAVDKNRFMNLETQLLAGMDTAVSSMLTLIKNIPEIINYYDPSYVTAAATIARNSSGLSMRLAMTCVDRMLAAQTALSGNDQHESWSGFDQKLNPDHFRLTGQDKQTARIVFADFQGLLVGEGYKSGPDHEPIPIAAKVGELACYQDVIIGCPITLLPGRMQELWSWYIDVVDSKGLWYLDQETQATV